PTSCWLVRPRSGERPHVGGEGASQQVSGFSNPLDADLRAEGFMRAMPPSSIVKRTLTVVLEKDVEGGFIASVAELPGCHSQGDTLEKVRSNIREAIGLCLEDADDSEPLPEFVGIERI